MVRDLTKTELPLGALLGHAVGVDLWEFYERVERLVVKLRADGRSAEGEAVEVAIRGGATSGEILGRGKQAQILAANLRRSRARIRRLCVGVMIFGIVWTLLSAARELL